MYGSAEVIGLMMAAVLELPQQAYHTARLQGRAMQYINFLRDVAEDNYLGRTYIPHRMRAAFGVSKLDAQTAQRQPHSFRSLYRREIRRYLYWQSQAAKGYHFLPLRYRIPVQTAATMYQWTALELAKNPAVVFTKKVKPSKIRVIITAVSISIASIFTSFRK